ncbi:MAG TPA: hypothetical protein VE242_00105 [Chthoniobacterales bacterium]|nr:hypothetical protein [Chthoniobacterales bacterium]
MKIEIVSEPWFATYTNVFVPPVDWTVVPERVVIHTGVVPVLMLAAEKGVKTPVPVEILY